ncbi:MAG: winged helix-turn-helix domain-containing protein [Candidatus Nanohaloarchaea archaeon]
MTLIDDRIEKVLDVLLDHPNVGYSKTELADKAEISRSTLYKIWDKLEQNRIVMEKKKYVGTTLYRLNPDSEIVNYLGKIMDEEIENSRKVEA